MSPGVKLYLCYGVEEYNQKKHEMSNNSLWLKNSSFCALRATCNFDGSETISQSDFRSDCNVKSFIPSGVTTASEF